MSGAAITVPGSRDGAIAAESLAKIGSEALAAFLAGRRWFTGKGSAIESVRVRDAVALFPSTAVARLDVRADGRSTAYQLPLAARPLARSAAPVVARVASSEGEGVVVDAAADPEFLEALGAAFAGGRSFAAGAVRWVVDDAGRAFSHPRPIAAEQSNSSIVYGDEAILKIYRRLLPGVQPDVEIGAYLAARRFPHVPRFLGAVRFEDADGPSTVAAVLQEFVAARGDAWSEALASARGASAAATSFASLAADLGGATAALHAALAAADDPAFVPEAIGEDEIRALVARIEAQVDRSLRLAEHSRGVAARLAARRDEAIGLARGLAGTFAEEPGLAIRHHGDFHLGQVLVTRDGRVVIVDFEGEPAKPLAERRRRASALRDVAGMLRSFGYAAHVATSTPGSGDAARTRAWEEEARAGFLDAYRARAGAAAFLPRGEEAARAGLALFELEKAFYELEYELENRPAWIAAPISGIERVLGENRSGT